MTKYLFRILTPLFLLFSTFSWSEPQNLEELTVRKIIIVSKGGDSEKKQPSHGKINSEKPLYFDAQAILIRLKTTAGEPFSQENFDQDLKLLAKEYFHVVPVVTVDGSELTVELTVTLKPMIRSINWVGNENIKTSNLRKELGVKTGQTFNRKTFTEAFNNIKAFYVRRGFFEAELNYTLHPDSSTNEMDIDIHINEGRSGRIENIELIGFSKKEKKLLMDKIISKKYNIFTSWITSEGTYRREMIQQDELSVTDFLQNEGYADAVVRFEIEESTKNNRIIIHIIADKGPCYNFGTISIEGNSLIDEETIRNAIEAKEGATFSPQAMRNSASSISDLYGRKGYIDTYATTTPHLDLHEDLYHVDIQVHEGELYRIGTINVYGNSCTLASVILNESLLIPGDVFDIRKLKQTENRLMGIGYFECVNVYPVPPSYDEETNTIFRDVNIEVVETGTGNFSASAGFSTMESIFGNVNLSEKNFNWRGIFNVYQCGTQALRGGGEYAFISATVGRNNHRYSFSWAKPFFCDTRWTVGYEIDQSSTRIKQKGFDSKSYGIRVYGMYQINEYIHSGVHYRFRDEKTTLSCDEKDPEQIMAADLQGKISAVGTSLNYDSTDSAYRPRDGFRSRLEFEYIGLGGDSHFSTLSYLNSYYFSLNCDNVLKFRADTRFIMPYGNTVANTIPLDERLYLGGETTVRGYQTYAIGPKFGDDKPKGGISQTLFSAEYRYFMHERVELFTFFDTGSVTQQHFTFGPYRASVGAGAHLCILPTAPVVIGYAIPLNAVSSKDEKKFFISLGGTF